MQEINEQDLRTYSRVSGVDWSHYKHPLPAHVYDVYMQYWRDARLACEDAHAI